MSAPRQILHVDMDAFYAAIEQRDDPRLRGRPVLIGGRSRRSVVCTASYEARPSGARSAMPMGEALRRCPDAIVVPPRIAHYATVSREIMAVLRRYSPLVEALSLDEAFVDVSASRALFGDGEAIARQIRDGIREATGLTASAGVSTSKFVSKIASDFHKPDGLTVVPDGTERAFLGPLAVGRMWGVGPEAQKKLHAAGLRTIGDLARTPPARLERLLGSWGASVHELAQGLDTRPVVPDRDPVSLGAEETFEVDLTSLEEIERALLDQSARVARRLASQGRMGRVVVAKIKLADFTLVTRRRTVPEPLADTTSIHRVACELVRAMALDGAPVRLTGVSVSDLSSEAARAPTLFPDRAAERRRTLEKLALAVDERFGDGALVNAGTLEAPLGLARRAVAGGAGGAIDLDRLAPAADPVRSAAERLAARRERLGARRGTS